MTPLNSSTELAHETSSEFLPRPYEKPQVRRQFDDLLKDVADIIAPVWPLKDYVAVNPYAGITQRTFLDARSFLKTFSDCETLMPIEYFAQGYRQGQFTQTDIQAAIDELQETRLAEAETLDSDAIGQQLEMIQPHQYPSGDVDEIQAAPNVHRAMRTFSQYLGEVDGVDWTEAICDEISRHCAAHYDEGQATWRSPWKDLPLYQAWRSISRHDRNLEALGLKGLRAFVKQLPHTPDAAIVFLLQRAQIPEKLWSAFLLCQAFSIPGWSAWAKYKSYWDHEVSNDHEDFTSLLAIRLAYDVALSEAFHLSVDWRSVATKESATFKASEHVSHDDALVRLVLLRASEIAYRNQLLSKLALTSNSQPKSERQRKLAQLVFCIDVRSERMRRKLEAASEAIETFGFAGFFGMPIEVVPLGQSQGDSHVPVLLKPQIKLHEGLHDSISEDEQVIKSDRNRVRTWRALWKDFQTSAVSCFSFVETAGLLYCWTLMRRAIGVAKPLDNGRFDGLRKEDQSRLGPTLRGLNHQGITTSAQVDLAHSMLTNLGLTEDFARLVVFCGHAGCTENNPLAAGLDCGACGGHSGEPNARLAALLLNQPFIRNGLRERGIVIPEDTHFLGAIHNTTTDMIELFDLQDVPQTHVADVAELRNAADNRWRANAIGAAAVG
ncbi:MAG: putative inorganic carbon transporter subunit DabA [Pirellulaceae bacterium]